MPEQTSTLVNRDAEFACLGACLVDSDVAPLVAAELRAEDWTQDAHRITHEAIRRLVSRGEPVDVLTLQTEIEKRPHDCITGTWTVALYERVPTAANIRHYIRLVREASIRRQIRSAAHRLAEQVGDPEQDVAALMDRLAQEVGRVLDNQEGTGARTVVPVAFSDALRAWQRSFDEEPERRVPTPFPLLTEYLDGGFGPGELVYLGAVASSGKTALALEVARAAAQDGTGVLIVSREMVIRALVRRLVAQAVRIPARTLKRGTLSVSEWQAFQAAYEGLLTLPIWMSDQAASLRDITGVVERWAFTPKLGLLIVDYLQLVSAPAESRRNEVEAVSKGLKGIALRQGIPVLCLSSLSRLSGEVKEKRPGLSRLKESSNLEHDADVVMFLYRECEMAEETECIIRKNRDGAKGTVYLRFRPEYVAFEQARDHCEGA